MKYNIIIQHMKKKKKRKELGLSSHVICTDLSCMFKYPFYGSSINCINHQ